MQGLSLPRMAVVVIIYTLMKLSDGCGRQRTAPYEDYIEDYEDTMEYQPNYPESQGGNYDIEVYPEGEYDYPTPPPTYSTTVRQPKLHRTTCRMEEEALAGCLNQGSCVVIQLNIRKPICECTPKFRGSRCQYRLIDPRMLPWQPQMRTAHIAAGVGICTMLMFVLVLSVYVYIRYHRKYRHLRDREFEASAEELYGGVDSIGGATHTGSSFEVQTPTSNHSHPVFAEQHPNDKNRPTGVSTGSQSQRTLTNTSTGDIKTSLLSNTNNPDEHSIVSAAQEKCPLQLGRCHNDLSDNSYSHGDSGREQSGALPSNEIHNSSGNVGGVL